MKVTWFGHASFRVESEGKILYFDPWKIPLEKQKADVIFITHKHYDHFSKEDIVKVHDADKTLVLAPEDCKEKLGEMRVRSAEIGEFIEWIWINMSIIPAYNLGRSYHKMSDKWVGYVVELHKTAKIYYAGDTDAIPEMEDLGEIDVAFLPIGGKYTMDVGGAVEAVRLIKPKIVIPMHYGSHIGTKEDASRFKEFVDTTPTTKCLLIGRGKSEDIKSVGEQGSSL